MSMSVALNSALSSLLSIEKQMSVAANNISNADVPGYTNKTADVSSVVSGGEGVGVEVTGISSTVDQNLLKDIVDAEGAAGYADIYYSYYDTLQEYMGTLSSSDGSGTDLSSMLSTLTSDLSTLATTPTSEADQSQVVSDLEDLTANLRDISDEIQQQRKQADSDIASTVSDINTQLSTIGSLNAEIQQASASGQETADLEDQRMSALESLSSDMDVSYYIDSSGNMQVYTGSGQLLVDGSTIYDLSYQTAASVSSDTVYDESGASGFSGIELNGTDITDQIQSGKLAALVSMRDTVLPQVQSELDTLASSLATTLNTIYNQGTSDPPPNSLTGTTTVSSGDALSATGTVRIAVLDSSGSVSSYEDLDLSSYSTVGDLVSALNDISGVSASIDADGHLVIAASDSSDGIAINEMSSALGSAGSGFSSYFGLNDLLTGDSAATIAVRSDLAATPSLLATGSLSSATTLTTGTVALTAGSSDIVTSLYDAMTAENFFTASGALGATTTDFTSYAASIISTVATNASNAETAKTTQDTALSTLQTNFSNESGVNTDTETALLAQLQDEYSASAKVISTMQSMFTSLLDAVAS